MKFNCNECGYKWLARKLVTKFPRQCSKCHSSNVSIINENDATGEPLVNENYRHEPPKVKPIVKQPNESVVIRQCVPVYLPPERDFLDDYLDMLERLQKRKLKLLMISLYEDMILRYTGYT